MTIESAGKTKAAVASLPAGGEQREAGCLAPPEPGRGRGSYYITMVHSLGEAVLSDVGSLG